MPGLLDFLNTPESALGIGLLAAGSQGKGLGAGLLDATNYAASVRQSQEESALRKQYRDMQMQAMRQEQEQRDAAMAAAQRKQQALPGLFNGAGFDWQAALAAGYTPDEIQKLANAPMAGQQEVARTVETTDEQGRPVTMQLDRFGKPVGNSMGQWKAPVSVNQGDRTTFLDPVTMQPRQSFGINMSVAERDASARGWASNRIAQERLNMAREQSSQGPKPTFNADAGGFIYAPSAQNPAGAVVPVPGFQKPLNDTQAKANLFGTRMQESDKIINNLSKDGKNFSMPGSGAGWGVGSVVNAFNSEQGQMLDQAKRDFTNAVLRRESGAAIADSEFDSANKQYFPQIGDSDSVIKQKARSRQLAIQGIMDEVPVAYRRAEPKEPEPKKEKSVPKVLMKGQIVKGYRYKGGDPSLQESWEPK